MNIIKRELRAHLKSFIIWGVSIFSFIFIMMSEFSAYYNNPSMGEILDMMPKEMLKAMSMEAANLTTVSGFISIASLYIYIMLAIYAVLMGSSIISKEERDKTVEFFMTLPISRVQAIFSKLVAAIILNLAINLVTLSALLLSSMQYDKVVDFTKFITLLMLGIFIIQMIFLSFGMLLAAVMKRYKKSGTIGVSILMILYIASIMMSFSDKLDFVKYFTPFKFFEANYILRELQFEGIYIVISFIAIAISLVGTFVIYPKRDLKI